MAEYNPYLVPGGMSGNKGGGQFVEDVATQGNIVWQTRFEHLPADEEAVAAALTAAFADGAETLDACAAALNRQGVSMPSAAPWTAVDLGEYLARLSHASL